MTGTYAALSFAFAAMSLYRVVTVWNELPDHVARSMAEGAREPMLVQVFRYLLLIGVAWLGAGLVLLADAISSASELSGAPLVLAWFGLVFLGVSIALMAAIRIAGRPRSLVPPSVRR